MKSFFEAIANIISGEKKEEKPKAKETQNDKNNNVQENINADTVKEAEEKNNASEKNNAADIEGSNSIDKESNIKTLIRENLQSYYKGKDVKFNDKILIIYILDNILFDSINNSEFKEDLLLYMDNELGYSFNSLDIKCGNPSQGETYTKITQNVLIRIKHVGNLSNTRKAILCTIPGYGSTIENEYILDSEELNNGKFYNIGVGKYPQMDNACFRENHIAIDDNPDSPQFENNRYVSRAHAHIGYTEKNGFMLYAEIGGTPLSGKRTEISRDGEIIRITSIMSPVALADGDCIILSRKVKLIFKTI